MGVVCYAPAAREKGEPRRANSQFANFVFRLSTRGKTEKGAMLKFSAQPFLFDKMLDTVCGIIYNKCAYNKPKENTMSKFDKLLSQILSLSKDLRFEEIKKVLEFYGYTMNAPRSGSSHYTFRKDGCMPITIPKHEPIKKVYVKMVKDIVEGEWNDK